MINLKRFEPIHDVFKQNGYNSNLCIETGRHKTSEWVYVKFYVSKHNSHTESSFIYHPRDLTYKDLEKEINKCYKFLINYIKTNFNTEL